MQSQIKKYLIVETITSFQNGFSFKHIYTVTPLFRDRPFCFMYNMVIWDNLGVKSYYSLRYVFIVNIQSDMKSIHFYTIYLNLSYINTILITKMFLLVCQLRGISITTGLSRVNQGKLLMVLVTTLTGRPLNLYTIVFCRWLLISCVKSGFPGLKLSENLHLD